VASEVSLYDLLGVGSTSAPKDIKAAYYAAIKTCHPDIDQSPAAHDLALKLIDAYRVLGDPERRAWYNARFGLDQELFVHEDVAPAAAEKPVESKTSQPISHPMKVSVIAEDFEIEPPAERPVQDARTVLAAFLEQLWRRKIFRAGGAGVAFAAGFALLLLVYITIKPPADRLTSAAAALPAAEFARAGSFSDSPASPCFDVSSGLRGDRLYRECVKTRVKLHLRMLRLRSGPEMEKYELQDAIAEIRQAAGAAQIRMTSTRGFLQESVATFADIKNSAKDAQVRRIAENYYYYYDCQALKHCTQ
jgi:hypothetical protein